MFTMKYAEEKDLSACKMLDSHISDAELAWKLCEHRYYIPSDGETPIGVLRYNLFWDSVPFLTLIFIEESCRGRGYGRMAMARWEDEMRAAGHGMVIISTQADEDAQHFYRKLGYHDAGGFVVDVPGYEQPLELFLTKAL